MDMQNKEAPVRFITSVYGKKYGGMLLSLLYSVKTSNPDANMTVFWKDVGDNVRLLEQVFPDYQFIDVAVGRSSDLIDCIAEKAPLWSKAARRYPGERLVLLDTDMLVIKDIGHFFNQSFDLGFTHKDEVYPINTGVILVRANSAALDFLDAWARRTQEINSDKDLRQQATTRAYPYGAPDQMAWWELIGFEKGKDKFRVREKDTDLSVVGFPCNELNETNSGPITPDTHIIHYKGGWHSILIDGTGFTSRRGKDESWAMYLLYLRIYKEALDFAAKSLIGGAPPGGFGIRTPFYLNDSLEPSAGLYVLFVIKERLMAPLRRTTQRLRRYLRRFHVSE